MMKYDTYKDSGIEWLGQIPEHWKTDRVKNIGSINGRVGWKALKASEYVDEGYFFLSTPNIKDVEIDFINVNYITRERYFESPEIMLNIGDILLVKDGSTLGIVNVIRKLPSQGTVNSSIGVIRIPRTESIFWYYFFQSSFIQNFIQIKKDGMGVPHLFQRDINNFDLLIPPLQEQTAIAYYLDNKTEAIGKKISLLQQKIENYKELRKSLINDAVTKGIRPLSKVQTKDSGIDWIGQIPKHWEVKRLKEFGSIETSSVNKKIEEDEEIIKLVNYTDVYDNPRKEIWNNDAYMQVSAKSNQISSKSLKKGDVLFTPSSETIEDIGVSAVVMEDLKETLYSYHLLRLKFKKKVDLSFKKYMLNNDFVQFYMSHSATGTTRKIIGLNTVYNTPVVLPPTKEEQTAIAQYLDEKTSKIDAIVSNIELQIEKLKELRKTLINDVVTGKIKVTTNN